MSDATQRELAPPADASFDWDNLRFAFTRTDTMFRADREADGDWDEGSYIPYGDLTMSPAATVLHYGQGVFEGMRAQRTRAGGVVLFRPLENGRRMADGAARLCMPSFPPERFVEVVKEVVRRNVRFVPPFGKGSLYVRPVLWGTGEALGVAPSKRYTFLVFVSPVGPYFKGKVAPINLEVTRAFHRAATKGTGNIKAIGNYAAGLLPAQGSKSQGFDEVIYLDAKHDSYIEEVGSANFFCVVDGRLLTPRTGSILPGITRRSVLKMAKEALGMDTEETDISLEQVAKASEAFCAGTAVTVCPIASITCGDEKIVYGEGETGPISADLYQRLTSIQNGDAPDPYGWVEPVF